MTLSKYYHKVTKNIFHILFATTKLTKGVDNKCEADNCSITTISLEHLEAKDGHKHKQGGSEKNTKNSTEVDPQSGDTEIHVDSENDHTSRANKRSLSEAQRKKCINITFAVLLLVAGTLDILTDWYNAANYSMNFENIEACFYNQSNEETEKAAENFKIEMTTVCSFATLAYILELLSFAFQMHYIHSKTPVSVLIYQEITSCLTLILEDFVMIMIIFIAFLHDVCPLFLQLRSVVGTIAITFTTVSVVLRAMQSLSTCCVCSYGHLYRGDNKIHCHFMMVCLPFRVIRSCFTVFLLGLIVTVLTMAYTYDTHNILKH